MTLVRRVYLRKWNQCKKFYDLDFTTYWDFQEGFQLPTQLKMGGGDVFTLVCLSVCLFVCLFGCEQDISRSYRWIWTELGGQVWCVPRTNWFDFGEDLDSDPTYQWDTKCKLFSLMEVCTLPGFVLVSLMAYSCLLKSVRTLARLRLFSVPHSYQSLNTPCMV